MQSTRYLASVAVSQCDDALMNLSDTLGGGSRGSPAGSDSFMPAEIIRTCSTVETGKLQPATMGVTVPAGQFVQIRLLAASQVRLRRSCLYNTSDSHRTLCSLAATAASASGHVSWG